MKAMRHAGAAMAWKGDGDYACSTGEVTASDLQGCAQAVFVVPRVRSAGNDPHRRGHIFLRWAV